MPQNVLTLRMGGKEHPILLGKSEIRSDERGKTRVADHANQGQQDKEL